MLQFIGDTDVLAPHLAAMALHRALSERGLEVRTLALAPGPNGGLEHDVPAISPGRGSFAARGVVRAESKWADVVIVHGPRALTHATLQSRSSESSATVVALWQSPADDDPHETSSLRRVGRSIVRRILDRADRVIAADPAVAERWSATVGSAVPIDVVPADLSDGARPVVDGDAWSDLLISAAR